MRSRGLPKRRARRSAVRPGRRRSLRGLPAYLGLGLGVILLVLAVILLVVGPALLNGYGRRKAERAFAEAHPGYALRLGRLAYSIGANRLVAQSVTLRATNSTFKTGRISLTGVRWVQLLRGTTALAEVLDHARLEATNLDAEFPQARYGIRCARLRASVPGSELAAEGTELRTLAGDEDFFAAHEFRRTRFQLVVPECRVSGLAWGELLQGKAYRAGSIHLSRPSFDALANGDKPSPPFVKSPLMVHEALAAVRQPLQVDRLTITNATLSYSERATAGAEPGVLTFGTVGISVEGIANRGDASAAILLRAQGSFMNAGVLNVLMTIPVTSPDFSLHYSGSLSAMDLTRLDAFLDLAEHTRIKSGSAQQATFEIEVTAGQAHGRVQAIYGDLEIAVLDKQTGTDRRFDHRVVSFLANLLKIRNGNGPLAAGPAKEGKVNYTRSPEDEFLEFVWFALWSGIRDVITH
jgi:hypothetical protein